MEKQTDYSQGEYKTVKDRVRDAVSGNVPGEYIFPFLWMHGEPHEKLREEIDAIYASNIREFCLESRVHEDFGREKWWDDMGFCLRYAREKGMRVWLLDDRQFPSGFANGWLRTHPELRRRELRIEFRDFAGPRKKAAFQTVPLREGESFVSVTAYKLGCAEDRSVTIEGDGEDLLGALTFPGETKTGLGRIEWDIPDGVARICYVIVSPYLAAKPEWIDMMSPESCKAMIEAVYGPTYEHFREYFGNTFAGFFSDEPAFSNCGSGYDCILGKRGMMLPYRDDLCELMAEKAEMPAVEVRKNLPKLFLNANDPATRTLRNAYMDVATKQFSANFSQMLADWSRAHGVEYIGHVIEDGNTHQRLGPGAGHYFRSVGPMAMAGIDIVLQQYVPGMTEMPHTAPLWAGEADPDFFNHLLESLPRSLAALTPEMKGRTMCEIFGAFGWAEGVPMMKKMLDLMLAGGINHFVPHAFSPKFPDPDCPPHFYAAGKNAQFEAFGLLMKYMAGMSHVLSAGEPAAGVAVLYNAEAEWCGGKCETLQKLAAALDRARVSFDIIWEDLLPECTAEDGKLTVRGRSYSLLLIPESPYLPGYILERLDKLSEGVKVTVCGERNPAYAGNDAAEADFLTVSWDDLGSYLNDALAECNLTRLVTDKEHPLLHFLRRVENGSEAVLFISSDNDFAEERFTLKLPDARERLVFDVWSGKVFKPEQDGANVSLRIPASGSVLLIPAEHFPESVRDGAEDFFYGPADRPADIVVEKTLLVSRDGSEREIDAAPGVDVTRLRGCGNFHGRIVYSGTIRIPEGTRVLRVEGVGEILTVKIGGTNLGTLPGPDCEFRIPPELSSGTAGPLAVEMEVVNSPAYLVDDVFSTFLPLPPSGITGGVFTG